MQSAGLVGMGTFFLQDEQPTAAMPQFEEALKLVDVMGNAQFQHIARSGLAKAYLMNEDLVSARKTVEKALQHKVPKETPDTYVLLGVIALRQGDHSTSHTAFLQAIEAAENLLSKDEHNYRPLDTKALAQYGLGLSEGNRTYVTNAIKSFSAARKIYKRQGYLKDLLALVDALAPVDSSAKRAEIRRAAGGES